MTPDEAFEDNSYFDQGIGEGNDNKGGNSEN